ncbi:MAG: tetrathionate reductase family octaheme c-type cytochrome [Candidatus Wenzhouxiangella sp. M2_3B_020]
MNDVIPLDPPPDPCRRSPARLACITVAALLMIPAAAVARDTESGGYMLPQADIEVMVQQAEANGIDIHEQVFSEDPYEGTADCLQCHESEGTEMLDTGHFKWAGKIERVPGFEGQILGKRDLINNFCVAVDTNEARCTQCHVGYGWDDKNYDFTNPENVDCLVCHDQSGTYKKGKKTAGLPDPGVDLNLVATSITTDSKPKRKNCIGCHAFAGGGDNVKHGDISSAMVNPSKSLDVHMGVDGANLGCTDCHAANHDPKTGAVNHGIAGQELHSVHEGEMRQCTDCHGSQEAVHRGTVAENTLFFDNWHERLACQTCHLPKFAQAVSTKTEWYWSDAGQDISPTPIDPDTGRAAYDKKKGTFNWEFNVRPVLRWYNGNWDRLFVGVNDTYDEVPIPLATPLGNREDPDAMIRPFKLMVGDQVVDPVNKTVMVPHLFGKKTGPNPYWGKFDWNLALEDASLYTGQPYSGQYDFVETTMYLTVNHQIAPADEALGAGGIIDGCMDCHDPGNEFVQWDELGWSGDPLRGGERTGP